jgi:predicted enzyme related to lactoylglutathione lyase
VGARLLGITLDCADAVGVATFWHALLGGRLREDESLPGWRKLLVAEPRMVLSFQPVPEAKVGKVRLHMDVRVDDIDASMHEVEALGGTFTGERHDYPGAGVVVVMADPEGNEFCLVQFT